MPNFIIKFLLSFYLKQCTISDARQGNCYTSLSRNGECQGQLALKLSKKDCCCGVNMGRAWGDNCDECPMPGDGRYIKRKKFSKKSFQSKLIVSTLCRWFWAFMHWKASYCKFEWHNYISARSLFN